jgi:hypothetical protein
MQPRGSSTNFFPKGLVAHRVGSDLIEHPDPSAPRTDLIVMGIVQANAVFTTGSTTDSSGGALDANGNAQSLLVETGTIGWFDTGTSTHKIQNANVDQVCYLYDNNTLYLDDLGGTLSAAGYVAQVRADGKVKLRVDASVYLANQDASSTVTSDDTVSYVITNLPAGAFAAGVWTATATGAISTTQDGLTVAPAVGDKVLFPPGTLTTMAVTAAQSGPYECVVAGATGVKAVYARTAKFAHGAIITPGTKVRVTLGGATTFSGTTWRCDPTTATKVVDTDDPVMFPERVVIPMTCSGGTATTALCPLRATGKFFVGVDFTGGSPAATTTNIVASTQTPGAIGTASIVIQEQAHLGTLVNTGTATANVLIVQ